MSSTGLSLRDARLLELAANGRSAEEMGALLGIKPAKALIRVKELLQARDIWTDIEQRQLLLSDLYQLKEQMQDQMRHGVDPKDAGVLLKTIKTIGDILDRQGKITEEELTKITQTQARALVGLVQAAMGRAEDLLREKYPYVDIGEIHDAFQVGLQTAAIEGVPTV